MLKRGESPIFEPGLDELLKKNLAAGRLNFTTDAAEGVKHGLFQFIAVGTPPDEDGSADLKYVLAVAESIGRNISEYRAVVTKSTVPVGTADKVRAKIDATLKARGAQHRVRRGVESRIPERGRGDRRLHEAGPHRRRHRQPAHGRAAQGSVRSVHAQPRAHDRDGCALLRADEVRRERDARDQDQLHERAGKPRRAHGRRHREGAPGYRLRPAHRLSLHLSGLRLRRLVLPERRAGAGAQRRRSLPSTRSCSMQSRR